MSPKSIRLQSAALINKFKKIESPRDMGTITNDNSQKLTEIAKKYIGPGQRQVSPAVRDELRSARSFIGSEGPVSATKNNTLRGHSFKNTSLIQSDKKLEKSYEYSAKGNSNLKRPSAISTSVFKSSKNLQGTARYHDMYQENIVSPAEFDVVGEYKVPGGAAKPTHATRHVNVDLSQFN